MFNRNEPIKVIHLQKLANQSMLNSVLAIEIVRNSQQEKLLPFDKARNVVFEKKRKKKKRNEKWEVKNIFPLDFIKYLSYLEQEKNSKVVNVQIRSPRVCSKSVTEYKSIGTFFW